MNGKKPACLWLKITDRSGEFLKKTNALPAAAVVAVLAAAAFIIWNQFLKFDFDVAYWKKTNQFYMVYDMDKGFDHPDNEGLSWLDMLKISYVRNSMAEALIASDTLTGLSKDNVISLLGEGNACFIIGDGCGGKVGYGNSLQYVTDADRRPFHFYGESGMRYAYLIVFFDAKNLVSSVDIIKP